ncbi:putative 3-ketoacyl-CoA ketothiolase, partial [Taphrina deformans PYCC 5710]
MTNRLKQIASHITGSSDDVVITLAIRTPLGKGFKGSFKDTPADMLALALLKAVVAKSGIDPALVEDICVGNVLGGSSGTYASRAAALAAGFPSTTSVHSVNRWCSSGLLSTQIIANAIRAGEIDIGLALGLESMSELPDRGGPKISPEILENKQAKDCTMPMGWTSENVAQRFNVSRQDQDAFAATSFQKAEAAQKAGYFDKEIIPVTTQIKDKDGNKQTITVTKDDGVRWGTTAESLAKLKPAFGQWGNGATTGGNASQITDGCAGVLLMRRSKALELNVPILARFVAATTVGCDPDIMGI